MDCKAMGTYILSLRTEAGLSQKELAKKVGARASDVSMWERGEYPPKTRQLKRLSDALGVSVSELLSGQSRSEEGPPADGGAALDTLLEIAETQQKTENWYRRFLLITGFLLLLVMCVCFIDMLWLLFLGMCIPLMMIVLFAASIVYFFLFRRTQRRSYAALVIGGITLLIAILPEAFLIMGFVLGWMAPN